MCAVVMMPQEFFKLQTEQMPFRCLPEFFQMDRTSNIVCKLLASTADGGQEMDNSLQRIVAQRW